MQKIVDIEISRSMHIPYAQSINDLEVQDYRFLSLFFQKERFWKNKNQHT